MRQEFTLRETIHHGGYYNVRDVLIQETTLRWKTLLAYLADSPYNARSATAPNEHTERLYADLVTTGHGDLGWARYDIVDRVTVFDTPVYVKFGLMGYGPDLEPEDTGHADIDSILEDIRSELDTAVEMLHDEAAVASGHRDYRRYHDARELADSLDSVRANFDPARRDAPLFNASKGGTVDFDYHMWDLIEQTFPLNVSTNGSRRLYVWEASE